MAWVNPSVPNLADYTSFIRGAGIGQQYLPDNSVWITTTLSIAQGVVNDAINAASPIEFTLAVYNLGVDRLINFAQDVEGETFFAQQRANLGIMKFAAGLVGSSSDSGTSQSLEVIEAAKRMTLTDLQMAKTFWGRTYMGIAQKYGTAVWGLT